MTILICYLIIVNIVAFFVYALDKHRAKHDKWRIPESTLLLFSAIGGSIGSLAAMKICHHKTRKKKFTITVPLLLILQIALIVLLVTKKIL